jgi:hypoxanthine-DNA glycosylase
LSQNLFPTKKQKQAAFLCALRGFLGHKQLVLTYSRVQHIIIDRIAITCRKMNKIETHPFKPFVPVNATVLIVGSFPGRDTTQRNIDNDKWFYNTKRNQFWDIISAVYNIELKTTKDKQELFKKAGIAIADIFLTIKRKGEDNSDTSLDILTYNDEAIRKILKHTLFEHIFFTSKFVEKHFLKLFRGIKNGECLPSPSPRYASMSKQEKIAHYKRKLPALRLP